MPAPAIVGAVVSIGFAATATGTVATAFAVAAAIGATAAAVGQITGVKELTIAGTILGAVGAVGGLASSAGLFGAEAGSLFGGTEAANSVTNVAGGGAAEVAQGAVTAGPAPAGGYTWSAAQVADPSLANVPSDVISMQNGGTSDIVDMLAGSVSQAPLTEAPTIADKAVVDVQPPAATNQVANAENLVPTPAAEAVNPDGLVPDPTKGLVDQTVGMSNPEAAISYTGTDTVTPGAAQNVDSYIPRDEYGNVIPQGNGGPSGSPAGPNGQNSTKMVDGNNALFGEDGAVPKVDGKVTTTDASSTPGAVAKPSPVTGQATPPAATPAATPAAAGQMKMPSAETLIYDGNVGGTIQRADNSIWGNIWKFTKENPAIAMGGIMAASSFLSGAMSPLTPAQTKELDARAEQNLAAANLANTQNELLQRKLDNMRQGIPQARWKNGGNGLVNMAVTGVPA